MIDRRWMLKTISLRRLRAVVHRRGIRPRFLAPWQAGFRRPGLKDRDEKK